jgi:hypothetical protein
VETDTICFTGPVLRALWWRILSSGSRIEVFFRAIKALLADGQNSGGSDGLGAAEHGCGVSWPPGLSGIVTLCRF